MIMITISMIFFLRHYTHVSNVKNLGMAGQPVVADPAHLHHRVHMIIQRTAMAACPPA